MDLFDTETDLFKKRVSDAYEWQYERAQKHKDPIWIRVDYADDEIKTAKNIMKQIEAL
jgi:hypothetical protein